MITLLFAMLIVLLASFVRAVSGFGFAMIATPLLTLLFDAKSVVVTTIILGSTTHILMLLQTRRHIDGKRLRGSSA